MRTVQQVIFDDEVMTAFGGGRRGGSSRASVSFHSEKNGSTTAVTRVGSMCTAHNSGVFAASRAASTAGAAKGAAFGGAIGGPKGAVAGGLVGGFAAGAATSKVGNAGYKSQHCGR